MKKTFFALAMAIASASAVANVQLKGTLTSVDNEQGTFTIESDRNSDLRTFEFKASTLVRRDGREYREIDALRVGDEVTYRLKSPSAEVDFVDVTVVSIDKKSNAITFVDANGKSQTLNYREGVRVDAGHSRLMKLEHLRKGDQVRLEVKTSLKVEDSLVFAR